MTNNPIAKRSGFLLLEALLAFSIFGIAVTSIVMALHRTAEVSQTIVHDQWITQEAQNILREALTAPRTGNDFTRDDSFSIDEFTEARILIEPYEAVDKDENILDELYMVNVTIYWDDDGANAEETFSTIHYASMFNSQNNR
jgi:Tfp pilus assembly protein PilV